jgi:hypothetical protein
VRQLDGDRQEPAPHAGVGGVVGGGRHPEADLPGARRGLLDVDEAQDLGAAHLLELHCLHDVILSLLLRVRSTWGTLVLL